MNATSVKKAGDDGFTRGLAYAAAQVVRLHDNPVCAADVILESQVSRAEMERVVDPYDMKVLRKLGRTESRLKEWYYRGR